MENGNPPASSCVCAIVPCYNEAPRIRSVLEALLQVRSMGHIIVVDDGSSDGSARVVAKLIADDAVCHQIRANIHLLVRVYNHGKSAAVLLGALEASRFPIPPEYLFLIDGDLRQMEPGEFELAIMTVFNDPAIDMLILRRIKKDRLTRWLGGDLLISGERIIRRTDLIKVLTQDPVSGFQLEVAINQYMFDNGKLVRWLPLSSTGLISIAKLGLWYGIKKEVLMFSRLLTYLGLRRAWRQITGIRHIQRA